MTVGELGAPVLGPYVRGQARERAMAGWPRCKGCGLILRPDLAGAGWHVLCWPGDAHRYDVLVGWARV